MRNKKLATMHGIESVSASPPTILKKGNKAKEIRTIMIDSRRLAKVSITTKRQ
jgi:hypothetical protein